MVLTGVKRADTKIQNTQIQIHNYTNTAHMTKCQEDPTCDIFLKRGLFKGIKSDIPMCQTCKFQNTNTQIHKKSIWRSARKTQHVVYYSKEDCSRVSKMIFLCVKCAYTKIQINKYTNTAYDEVPERPNLWYTFEKAIVQGYLLSLAQLYKVYFYWCFLRVRFKPKPWFTLHSTPASSQTSSYLHRCGTWHAWYSCCWHRGMVNRCHTS